MPYTVRDLIADRPQPVTVDSYTFLSAALEIMVENDFSQLPVVDNDDLPIGIITTDSILKAIKVFGVGPDQLRSKDAIERARQYYLDDDIFDLMDGFRDRYAILIVHNDDKLIDIATATDATQYFRRQAEDNMLVEDIELAIREHIEAAFTDEKGVLENDTLHDTIHAATQKRNLDFDKLTLGQYMRVLLHETTWSRYSARFNIDKTALETMLESVRNIRNELAHFRGKISKNDRERLVFTSNWFERHSRLITKDKKSPSAPIVNSIDFTSEEVKATDSRYSLLALYLQKLPGSIDRIALSFTDIERIIEVELPVSARKHRAWWANDSTSHIWSKLWLEAGWRSSHVNLTEEQVVFSRVVAREKAYVNFFSALVNELKAEAPFSVINTSPNGSSWANVRGLPRNVTGQPVMFAYVFAQNRKFRVEAYIDTGDKEKNKRIFDLVHIHQTEIEAYIGDRLEWERIDNKRASRIAMYRENSNINDEPSELDNLRLWAVEMMIKFEKALAVRFEEALKAIDSNS